MNPEVRAAWVAALRSGQYKQGRGLLHNLEEDSWCCLGVLCDLARAAGVVTGEPGGICEVFSDPVDIRHASYPPKAVVAWAGLGGGNPYMGGMTAVQYNDGLELSFEKIADKVEEYL